jgi:demethylmenaquinone methyltransferase/2-methoxy-6-polyprenyl-1,4-benzoquinol methylase
MVNKYFAPGTERASKVRDLFATIAPRYDLINDLQSLGLHRYWKRRLLRLAGVKAGERVLDLCCGTGDVALAFARSGARVAGLDFSAPMLAIARFRLSAQSPVDFIQSDALRTPFVNESFDVVTVSYGLRNLSCFQEALLEMWRVLKPGGRLLVLDFGKPEKRLWRAVYFGYLRIVVPLFGLLLCGDSQAYAYILQSLKSYPAQRGVDQVLRSLRSREVRIFNFLGGAMSINCAIKESPT